ncbi:MAG TPA: response regulator [Burkholderiaceae bacterium]|nr:response regulator [Burkholderiaceae bacterium]
MNRVLIVEDNALNMKLARTILVSAGYAVLEAANAEDGLALARAHQPAVVLMDIHLPGIDGITAVKRMRADPLTRETKVLAITALAMKGDRERILAADFDGYVSKPFEIQVLLGAVKSVLSGQTGSDIRRR